MITDHNGKKWLKVGLHTHTTLSDGKKTPEEVIAMYAEGGYDVLAITDHWKYAEGGQTQGMQLLSGCEYDMAGTDQISDRELTFHIVGVGMAYDPQLPAEYRRKTCQVSIYERVRTVVEKIRQAGGLAILAHPAWSLNTPEQIRNCGTDFDAVEIYNSVSEHHMSDRPYSGQIVDMLASEGIWYPIVATDDTHYYTGDEMRGITMVDAAVAEEKGLLEAIRAGACYGTQGPELSMERISEDEVRITCSPAVKVAFLSNVPWVP